MKYATIISLFFIFSCNSLIKNEDAKINDEVASKSEENSVEKPSTPTNSNTNLIVKSKEDLIGNWVGWFEPDIENNEIDETYYDTEMWGRENKISLCIDKIEGDRIIGHSVVAGNNRPFQGSIVETDSSFNASIEEPGDNKYDGKFLFTISKSDTLIKGNWTSFKKIDVSRRKYELAKKAFQYNASQNLNEEDYRQFIDWEKTRQNKKSIGDEVYAVEEFVTSTNSIYKFNASTQELKKSDVENLKRPDLQIIRNMIYARHGYSFKNRPLRVFFDAQDWYVPVSNDVKDELTEVEKKNIQLLLKYEKSAKEYYDYFGRL